MSALLDEFKKYAQLIRPMLDVSSPQEFTGEDASTVRIERGLVFPRALLDAQPNDLPAVERLIELANSPRLSSLRVIDVAAHTRPCYRGLFAYAWLQSFGLMYETLPRNQFGRWEEALRTWCDLLEAELGTIAWPAESFSASEGASAVISAWNALTLFVAGKIFIRDAWTDLAADTFGRFAKRQLPSGALLQANASDSLETLGYDELATLHAIASYAVQAEDRAAAGIVARATAHHANNTQADHSTNQPWAAFAFMWNESTRPVADQMLHAAATHRDSVSLLLLADALYCVNQFLQK